MISYLIRHLQVLTSSVGQLVHHPGSTLMTVFAIGVTLALPALLYLLAENVEDLTHSWRGRAQLSIFLRADVGPEQQLKLADELSARADVERTRMVTADQALAEFKQTSGFGTALDALKRNPLPSSIVVYMHPDHEQPEAIERLVMEIEQRPGVEKAQWDLAWIKRLHVSLRLTQRGVTVLTLLLVFAVVVIISNTIRLSILNRRDEIEIMKLIGATDGFIRRPFLYGGLLQGLFGAAAAWFLIVSCQRLLQGPVAELAHLYSSGFEIRGLNAAGVLALLSGGAGLGWLAARGAVARHLAKIEPR